MDWGQIDDSPGRIRALLEERGLALKKRWGQNFMVSRTARRRIVELLHAEREECVWEIGPGLGGITAVLLESGHTVTVFEVDWGLIEVLRERFGDAVTIVPGDATTTLVATDAPPPVRAVGNLPYRSASAIISLLMEAHRLAASLKRMVFTIQREVGQRMVAGPGDKDYSAFSVLCSLAATVTVEGDLSKGNFYPPPGIVSSFVSVVPSGIDPTDLARATHVARSFFSGRRKTVLNNLKAYAVHTGHPQESLIALSERAGISLEARPDVLEPGAYLALGKLLRE